MGVSLLMIVTFFSSLKGFFSAVSLSSLLLLKESAGKFRTDILMSKMLTEEGGVLESFQMTKVKFSLK